MKTLFIMLSAVVVFSSCNSGGGGANGAPGSGKLGGAQSDLNQFTVIKANLNYEEEKDRLTVGCKTPGNHQSIGGIDPQLSAGQVFKEMNSNKRRGLPEGSSVVSTTISFKQANKIVLDINFEDVLFNVGPFTSLDQVFTTTPHIQNELTVTTQADGSTSTSSQLTYNYTPEMQQYVQSHPENDFNEDCSIKPGPTNKYERTIDKILYYLDGRSDVAFLEKSNEEGEVVCKKYKINQNGPSTPISEQSLGHGTIETTYVDSNQFVEKFYVSCGGTQIFRQRKVTIDSGVVVSDEIDKTLSAPRR